MSKRKILALALTLSMVAILAIGGTLAYFTDTDSATNVFTVGNVKVQLIEQERDGNGGLKEFTNKKNLMPIVGSAQDEKDALGLPTAKNYVDKVVTVMNTGESDAYIRAYFAIPSALDDGEETFNAGLNILHFNFGNKIVDGKATTTFQEEWIWQKDGKWKYFETEIDGVKYNVYYADYFEPVEAGATTERFVDGVYLDKTVDKKEDGWYAFGKKLEGNILDGEVKCPVYVIACQAEGFDSAEAAMNEAFGANYNPWKK